MRPWASCAVFVVKVCEAPSVPSAILYQAYNLVELIFRGRPGTTVQYPAAPGAVAVVVALLYERTVRRKSPAVTPAGVDIGCEVAVAVGW